MALAYVRLHWLPGVDSLLSFRPGHIALFSVLGLEVHTSGRPPRSPLPCQVQEQRLLPPSP